MTIDLRYGDTIEQMKLIPDKSIDFICCDLPYGTTSCSWDTIIPFDKLWEQYKRIIKPNKPIVLFGSQPFTTVMINSNTTYFKEEVVWLKNKAGSGMQTNQKHQKIHENIIVFSFDNKYTYNPQKWLIEEKEFITQRKTFKENEYVGNTIYSPTTRTRKVDTGERNPLSIISGRVPFTPQKSKEYSSDIDLRFHPTQKPLRVLEYIIETFSNENDIVLDNTFGSCTTGIACINTNRNFIGIENNMDYFNISLKRVEEKRKEKDFNVVTSFGDGM
jgi:site-specific DNA-methyltransferase (adenine-specific)